MRKSIEEKDEGFTLIELLVVIIIIGILAAIAIPVFLNQRKKGWDAEAKSDLRNAATAEETVLTDNNAYTTTVATLVTAGFKSSANTTLTVVSTRGTGAPAAGVDSYCLKAVSKSTTNFYYDSAAGGISTTVCT
ncbi:MAG: prepilin-type N-terminal cleavage/methylation domain-containing protein [Mycobacteriales bacterium]